MDEILECECGCKDFRMHEEYARCSKCLKNFYYIAGKGWLSQGVKGAFVHLDINTMNTIEPKVG